MSVPARRIGIALVVAAVISGCGWWLASNMERYAGTVPFISQAARKNPMLGATRLLQQHGREVAAVPALGDLRLGTLGDGVLLMPGAYGVVSAAQARQLGDWVRRGNVLVATPRWLAKGETAFVETGSVPPEDLKKDDEDEDEDEDEPEEQAGKAPERDPIAAMLGVRRTRAMHRLTRCLPGAPPLADAKEAKEPRREAIRISCVPLPGSGAMIEVDNQSEILATLSSRAKGHTGGEAAEALRDYPLGKGRIVMVPTNYFDNASLKDFDHGELLLAIAALQPRGKVVIIGRLGVTPWMQELWQSFSFALVAAAVALLAALWMALRRFGPLLPPAEQERRSLMEHVNASGAWLWKSQPGRDLLLEAARGATLAVVRRRVPALDGMDPARQAVLLARMSRLPAQDIELALCAAASHHTQEFTRQIRTLQQLRTEHER
jgi:hypothetical protein